MFFLQAYGLAGRWEDALALIPRAVAAGAYPDEQLYCGVMNALGDNGAWRETVALIQSMRSGGGGDAADGTATVPLPPRPSQSAYDCACRACGRAGQAQAVLELMSDMREDGVARNAAMYAALIRAFAESGEWKRAVELVQVEVGFLVWIFIFIYQLSFFFLVDFFLC